jgi:hypothetical protein
MGKWSKRASHHVEGLVNPEVGAQKKVTDFVYPRAEHVDSKNIKLKIGPRPLFYQLFSKRDFNS